MGAHPRPSPHVDGVVAIACGDIFCGAPLPQSNSDRSAHGVGHELQHAHGVAPIVEMPWDASRSFPSSMGCCCSIRAGPPVGLGP